MSIANGAAFWSYAHEDDRLASGGIVGLARHLAAEYSLITGNELRLFVDRDLTWGEEWRKRIDEALTETTFFVAVMTPRYFSRPECRNEAIAFNAKAQSLGLGELMLPILYSPVAEFNEENPDQLISLMSRYQNVDWIDLRLEGTASSLHRRAVNSLAQRLAAAGDAAATKQLRREVAVVEGLDDAEPGLLELVRKIDALVPDWLEAMESNIVGRAQFQATWSLYGPRLHKLERSPGRADAKFALIQRLAKEELPLAERQLEVALVYTRIALELDPLVEAAMRFAERDEDAWALLQPFWSAVDKAEELIRIDRAIPEPSAGAWARQRAHISRLVRQTADVFEKAETHIEEGNTLVDRWLAARQNLLGGDAEDRLATNDPSSGDPS